MGFHENLFNMPILWGNLVKQFVHNLEESSLYFSLRWEKYKRKKTEYEWKKSSYML